MRLAVIGAGIVGVTTAYELAADGHEVEVWERCASVAEQASFANAGVIAPGYVTPWAAPGMARKVLAQRLSRHAAVRFGRSAWRAWPWLWRWWRACRPETYRANRSSMQRLARFSRLRLDELTTALGLEYEQAEGYLVLLRTPREARAARASLELLAELGVMHEWVDGGRARELEPGLNPQTPLEGAIHLPRDGVGNCRQFAQVLRAEAERAGARFRFASDVVRVAGGTRPIVEAVGATGTSAEQAYDGVVVCAGHSANRLLKDLGFVLPLAPIYGYSITAPLRRTAEPAHAGPRSAVMDERYKVAISRLGQRVRVAGSAEIGGTAEHFDAGAMATLYRVLDDWFPGAAQLAQAQRWKGARPMLPDGPPVIGASGVPGVWLNLGHGSSGWALSCGSARVLADHVAGRAPAIDTRGIGIERLRR